MARLTPEEYAEKQSRRLKGSLEDMRKGIERVATAPTKQAAAKQDKMKAHLNAAIDDGSWKRGLEAVTLESWKADMTEKGLSRVAGGIDRAQGKVVAFAGKLLPYIDGVQAKIKGMPDVTLEDSINRVTTNIREMSKFHK